MWLSVPGELPDEVTHTAKPGQWHTPLRQEEGGELGFKRDEKLQLLWTFCTKARVGRWLFYEAPGARRYVGLVAVLAGKCRRDLV